MKAIFKQNHEKELNGIQIRKNDFDAHIILKNKQVVLIQSLFEKHYYFLKM